MSLDGSHPLHQEPTPSRFFRSLAHHTRPMPWIVENCDLRWRYSATKRQSEKGTTMKWKLRAAFWVALLAGFSMMSFAAYGETRLNIGTGGVAGYASWEEATAARPAEPWDRHWRRCWGLQSDRIINLPFPKDATKRSRFTLPDCKKGWVRRQPASTTRRHLGVSGRTIRFAAPCLPWNLCVRGFRTQ